MQFAHGVTTASDRPMKGRLVGVGVGPGDPDLVTLRGLELLRRADSIFVPVTDTGEVGRAEAIVRAHLGSAEITRLAFAMSDESSRARSWDSAGAQVATVVAAGGCAAFATIGDPNIYSTFAYLAQTVRSLVPRVSVETVPGITAMQELAAKSGTVLVEGTERLALFPLTAGLDRLREALEVFDTIVCYKGGRDLPHVTDVLRASDRMADAVYGARLGLEDEEILPVSQLDGRSGPYLSTVIVPAPRSGRGSKL